MLLIYEEDGYQWAGSDKPFETPYEAEVDTQQLDQKAAELFNQVCDQLPSAEGYIKQYAERFGWRPELIECGKTYRTSALPLPVKYFEPFWWCFENSFLHAKTTGLLYVEGIVVTPTGSFVHAWNSSDDNVLDYTYPLQHLNSYFGIAFEVELIEKYWPMSGGLLGYLYEEVKTGKPGFAHRLLYG